MIDAKSRVPGMTRSGDGVSAALVEGVSVAMSAVGATVVAAFGLRARVAFDGPAGAFARGRLAIEQSSGVSRK